MTPEERIARLEAEVRSLRLIAEGQAAALRAANERLKQEGDASALLAERRETARLKKRRQRAEREAAFALSRDSGSVLSPGQCRDNAGTTLPPPLEGSPPPSVPSSPSPISSPPSLFPPSAVASKAPRRKAKKREPTGDPRHAPLVKALVGLGWPHHGGRTAKALKELLALADQVPATAGDKAQAEILRRAAKAKASTGFPQVRELHELATHWGHFAGQTAASSALPRADDPDWVTV